MNLHSLRLSIALICLLSPSLFGEADFYPAEQVKPGMEGTGKTVFEGTQVEEFGVVSIVTALLGLLRSLHQIPSLHEFRYL